MDLSPSPSTIILSVVAIILIVFSMIFSAAESAFLSINKLRVRFLRNKKNKKAIRVWKLLQSREKLINALLVGNNIVNIALSAIITILAVRAIGNAGVGLATLCATILLLIFGEITPKTIATHHPEPVAFFFSGFILFLVKILTPVVFVLSSVSSLFLKIFKIDVEDKKVTFTKEDIKTIIDVSSEQGVLEKDGKQMMQRVFKFHDLAANDIMIPRKNIRAISIGASYSNIIEFSERYRLSRFPVYKKDIDDIVGILYVKDLLAYKTHSQDFKIENVMRSPLFILETKKMSSIQQTLQENHQSMAVVIDEYSGTQGVLTCEDIVREIFGSVTDEYKPYTRRINFQVNTYKNTEIDGLVRLMDLNEQLKTKMQSERCETLGGYICETLGKIPVIGDTIACDGYKFTVVKMDDKRIARVLVRPVEKKK